MADDLKPRTASTPQPISVRTIFNVVDIISTLGHRQDFLDECDKKNLSITISHEIINFIKTYLLDRGTHKGELPMNSLAKNVIISPGGRCPDES